MPRSFDVPPFYRSQHIALLKRFRQQRDPRKKDSSPTTIDFGPVQFKIARHFGFCFGVENAIEIAYRAIQENPDKRIFLLSEMIHNPGVNNDLRERGVEFLMNTDGSRRVNFSELSRADIVIVPAFGTTVELQDELDRLGIDPYRYDTTCPFVEKVWKRSAELGRKGFTVIVHGKRSHEETRATFSHSRQGSPTLVLLDRKDAEFLASFIRGEVSEAAFYERFSDCVSDGFNPQEDLLRLGVVNQTTMLASETVEITEIIKEALLEVHGTLEGHFADTRDTLCYATYENQRATRALLESKADLALVVGGYNSSNTSHLVELFSEVTPVYYIKDATEIFSANSIQHFNLETQRLEQSENWLPEKEPVTIALTSGASCPDATVYDVMVRVCQFFEDAFSIEQAFAAFELKTANSN